MSGQLFEIEMEIQIEIEMDIELEIEIDAACINLWHRSKFLFVFVLAVHNLTFDFLN